jgi:hypothetical protein
MFQITESAHKIIEDIVNREKVTKDEELFLRLSMGIG